MTKIAFYRKQPSASDDYESAYDLINGIKKGQSKSVTPVSIGAFRKYAYDLAAKQQKKIRTEKEGNSLTIYCLQ